MLTEGAVEPRRGRGREEKRGESERLTETNRVSKIESETKRDAVGEN